MIFLLCELFYIISHEKFLCNFFQKNFDKPKSICHNKIKIAKRTGEKDAD